MWIFNKNKKIKIDFIHWSQVSKWFQSDPNYIFTGMRWKRNNWRFVISILYVSFFICILFFPLFQLHICSNFREVETWSFAHALYLSRFGLTFDLKVYNGPESYSAHFTIHTLIKDISSNFCGGFCVCFMLWVFAQLWPHLGWNSQLCTLSDLNSFH